MEERWRQRFNDYSTSSFVEILRATSPSLLPPSLFAPNPEQAEAQVPHGTTVLAIKYRDGDNTWTGRGNNADGILATTDGGVDFGFAPCCRFYRGGQLTLSNSPSKP